MSSTSREEIREKYVMCVYVIIKDHFYSVIYFSFSLRIYSFTYTLHKHTHTHICDPKMSVREVIRFIIITYSTYY